MFLRLRGSAFVSRPKVPNCSFEACGPVVSKTSIASGQHIIGGRT